MSEKKQIMLFEDEETTQELMKKRLTRRGYEVHIASSGETGLAILEELKDSIDVILMDLQMPGLSGRDTTKLILENPELSHIPIIAVSAHIDYREKEALDQLGFHSTFFKPVDFDRLNRTLTHVFAEKASKTG